MNIKEGEEALFSSWQNERQGFAADGVVSESDYSQSKLRLCFVLKTSKGG